jgi:hypothetical protein
MAMQPLDVSLNPAAAPPRFTGRMVAVWAGSTALGLGIAALGHLPATFGDLSGLDPASAQGGLLSYFMLSSLGFILAGGATTAFIQYVAFTMRRDTVATRWLWLTLAGWAIGWGFVLFQLQSQFERILVLSYKPDPLTPTLFTGIVHWAFAGFYIGIMQNLAAPKRSVWWRIWALLNPIAWAAGAAVYWGVYTLLAGTNGFVAGIVSALLAGGAIGGTISGIFWWLDRLPIPTGVNLAGALDALLRPADRFGPGAGTQAAPLDRAFAGWWAGATALGLGLASLGHLPLFAFANTAGVDPGLRDAALWGYIITIGWAGVIVGGFVLAWAQWRVLLMYREALAGRWLVVTLAGWIVTWTLALGLIGPLVGTFVGWGQVQALLGTLVWTACGIVLGLIQRLALQRRIAQPASWALVSGATWFVGGLAYVLLQGFLDPFGPFAWLLAPVLSGALIGLLQGVIFKQLLAQIIRQPAPA